MPAAVGGAADAGAKPTPAPAAKPAGASPFTDYTTERTGKRVRITPADLPPPRATKSADNPPRLVKRPKGACRRPRPGSRSSSTPTGWRSRGCSASRPTATCSWSRATPASLRVVRGLLATRQGGVVGRVREGLNQPFGIAFYPPGAEPRWLYVANTDSVVRFPYKNGDLQARGPAETIVEDLPGGGRLGGGGHWTRDLEFSPDGKTHVRLGRLAVERRRSRRRRRPRSDRADILAFDPDGKDERVYASGIRNPVGLAVHPRTGELWASVNERDEPGRPPGPRLHHARRGGRLLRLALVLHRRQPGPAPQGQAPRAEGQGDRPRRAAAVALGLARHDLLRRQAVPGRVRGDVFAAEHGSWNRARAHRLQGDPRADAGRQGDRRVRGLPDRLRHRRTATSGAGRSASRWPRTARCWSPTTARIRSGA